MDYGKLNYNQEDKSLTFFFSMLYSFAELNSVWSWKGSSDKKWSSVVYWVHGECGTLTLVCPSVCAILNVLYQESSSRSLVRPKMVSAAAAADVINCDLLTLIINQFDRSFVGWWINRRFPARVELCGRCIRIRLPFMSITKWLAGRNGKDVQSQWQRPRDPNLHAQTRSIQILLLLLLLFYFYRTLELINWVGRMPFLLPHRTISKDSGQYCLSGSVKFMALLHLWRRRLW